MRQHRASPAILARVRIPRELPGARDTLLDAVHGWRSSKCFVAGAQTTRSSVSTHPIEATNTALAGVDVDSQDHTREEAMVSHHDHRSLFRSTVVTESSWQGS